MTPPNRPGDPNKVVKEKWYEYLLAAVVVEEYEDGGVSFSVVTWDGEKKPLQNIHWFYEEAWEVTKEEAMRHLENVRQMIAKYKEAKQTPL